MSRTGSLVHDAARAGDPVMFLVFPLAFDRVDHHRPRVVVLGQLHVNRRLHHDNPFTADRVKLEVFQQNVFGIGRKGYPRQ
ncbi:hypothetical protein D3C80_1758630 [compost metagenome]